jgi:hypothetical protein
MSAPLSIPACELVKPVLERRAGVEKDQEQYSNDDQNDNSSAHFFLLIQQPVPSNQSGQ